jgi:ABC-type spermidine/putrescine transport system permease subunit I
MTTPSLFCLALLVLVLWAAPQQLPIIAYKLALVTGAGVAGYGLDRALFPYARPHVVDSLTDTFDPATGEYARPHVVDTAGDNFVSDAKLKLFVTAQVRRAVIVAAAMLAVGLGL